MRFTYDCMRVFERFALMIEAMRIATYNVENLFQRSKVLNLVDTPEEAAEASEALKAADALQKILIKTVYSAADKTKIVELIAAGKKYITVDADKGTWLTLVRVTAKGRGDFLVWIVCKAAEINEEGTKNTGKVIRLLEAEVLCLVEVEDRELLGRFNSQVLTTKKYEHYMLIDGNDDRGIDVALMSRLPIRNMRTHVHDRDGKREIFSRECPEYEVGLPDGRSLWVLPNHLKSQAFGSQAANDARRKRQSERIAEILGEIYDLQKDLVVVAGDLNDTPESAPLAPLLGLEGLHDVAAVLPEDDRYTYIYRGKGNQIDYLLVSEPLREALQTVTMERRGMHKVEGHLSTVTNEATSASDHAAIVAEFAL